MIKLSHVLTGALVAASALFADWATAAPAGYPFMSSRADQMAPLEEQTEQGFELPAKFKRQVVGYAFAKDGKPDMAAIGAAAEKMKPQVAVLDRAVASTGYLAGESFTLADINILPMLFYVNRFEEGKAILGAAKNLSAYMERHFARPSFKASAPPPPPAKN